MGHDKQVPVIDLEVIKNIFGRNGENQGWEGKLVDAQSHDTCFGLQENEFFMESRHFNTNGSKVFDPKEAHDLIIDDHSWFSCIWDIIVFVNIR